MASTPLQQIIAAGESLTVEFKVSVPDLDTIGKIVCSFLNTKGGTLVIGVNEEGQIVGVEAADREGERIQQVLLDRISPKAPWSVNIDEIAGTKLIVIDVPQGSEIPYVYGNGIFVRHGTATLLATSADITSLINQRSADGRRWERLPALGFEISDLDADEIKRTASEAQERRLYRFNDATDPLKILEQLNLSSGGIIFNSAVILYGKDPARRYPQVRIRAARFKGRASVEAFTDNRAFEGHAFMLIQQLEQFLRNHVPIESQFAKQGLVRSDHPIYPWQALREAMLNSIVHRDYAAFDGGISVAIYDDRIEFWNSGNLPQGMTVDDLKGPHPSRPHNPDIANIFFLRGLMERWGMGTEKIVRRCLEIGLPEPVWETGSGGVKLTLRLTPKEAEIELNSRQRQFLEKTPYGWRINPADYFKLVSQEVKERRARQDLQELFDAGYLRREGKGRSTFYIRTNKPSP